MKNEGEFNMHLSKDFKRRQPELYALKVADKFSIGISDFLLFYVGTCIGMEVKLIKDWPIRKTTKIMTHPFAGGQRTFLESIKLTRNDGFGLVGVDSERRMYCIPMLKIPESGNWTHQDFVAEGFKSFDFDEIEQLINYMFDLPF